MNKTKRLAVVCMLAAVYTALSVALAPISYGNIQCRVSEALTLLPMIYAPAVPAVTLGCFLTNLIGAMTGANILGLLDVAVGTFATGMAAYLTYKLREKKLLAASMPVIFNGVIIGAELGYVLFPESILTGSLICGLEVAAGEALAVVLGLFLIKALSGSRIFQD